MSGQHNLNVRLVELERKVDDTLRILAALRRLLSIEAVGSEWRNGQYLDDATYFVNLDDYIEDDGDPKPHTERNDNAETTL